jgi:hypothetical protein
MTVDKDTMTVRRRVVSALHARIPRPSVLRSVAVSATVLLVAGISFAAAPLGDGTASPAATVRQYLEAARDGDVDEALRLADAAPRGEAARFLDAAALNHGWDIDSVTAGVTDASGAVEVSVTISADGRQRSGTFSVVRNAGQWRITDPFVEVGFSRSPLWFVQVGQVTAPFDADTVDQGYFLLPGLYDFYAQPSKVVEWTSEAMLVLPGESGRKQWIAPSKVALTSDGETAAESAIADYVDDCAREADDFWVENCPFSTDGAIYRRMGYQSWDDPTGVSWKVEEYPKPAFKAVTSGFSVTDDELGVVTLSGSATEKVWDGDDYVLDGKVDFSLECQIQAGWLQLGVTEEGTLTVRHIGSRDGKGWSPGDFPDNTIDTCRA